MFNHSLKCKTYLGKYIRKQCIQRIWTFFQTYLPIFWLFKLQCFPNVEYYLWVHYHRMKLLVRTNERQQPETRTGCITFQNRNRTSYKQNKIWIQKWKLIADLHCCNYYNLNFQLYFPVQLFTEIGK